MWIKTATIATLAVAALALYSVVWVPLECNWTKGEIHRSTSSLETSPETIRTRQAGENVQRLSSCLQARPRDVEILVLAAANLHHAGRHAAALELYCGALRYDRRPEIYLGCGEMQALTGDSNAALDNFVRAGEFALPRGVLSQVSDGRLRMEAHRIVGERLERNLAARGELDTRNVIRNGSFTAVQTSGISTPPTQTQAPFWEVLAGSGDPPAASLIPSSRRPSGRSLRVITQNDRSGVFQRIPSAPRRMIVSAWVFVNEGVVCLGSGIGTQPMVDVCSESTGRWEMLESMNQTCPATGVTLVSRGGGADFIVDQVRGRVTYLAPCGRR
jgi:hypothetical protein